MKILAGCWGVQKITTRMDCCSGGPETVTLELIRTSDGVQQFDDIRISVSGANQLPDRECKSCGAWSSENPCSYCGGNL